MKHIIRPADVAHYEALGFTVHEEKIFCQVETERLDDWLMITGGCETECYVDIPDEEEPPCAK